MRRSSIFTGSGSCLPPRKVENRDFLANRFFLGYDDPIDPADNGRVVEKFKEMLADYNSGSHSLEEIYQTLISFSKALDEEEQRAVREGLGNEEELAIFDLLTNPEPKLSKQEKAEVKEVARELLQKLKDLLVLDWRAKEFARASVELAIKATLDHLPTAYDKKLYDEKCTSIFSHVYDEYYGDGKSIY